MKRKDALDMIAGSVSKDSAIISSTGLMSRELYENHDSEQQFYMPGSMGLASSIGLGIAVNNKKQVIVVDGDASLLMNLGTMITIGKYAPKNFIHVVLDNRAYASCSEEPSLSDEAKLDKIANIVGYRNVQVVDNEESLYHAIKNSYGNGPSFILTHIELGGRRDFSRPKELKNINTRFRKFLSS